MLSFPSNGGMYYTRKFVNRDNKVSWSPNIFVVDENERWDLVISTIAEGIVTRVMRS